MNYLLNSDWRIQTVIANGAGWEAVTAGHRREDGVWGRGCQEIQSLVGEWCREMQAGTGWPLENQITQRLGPTVQCFDLMWGWAGIQDVNLSRSSPQGPPCFPEQSARVNPTIGVLSFVKKQLYKIALKRFWWKLVPAVNSEGWDSWGLLLSITHSSVMIKFSLPPFLSDKNALPSYAQ